MWWVWLESLKRNPQSSLQCAHSCEPQLASGRSFYMRNLSLGSLFLWLTLTQKFFIVSGCVGGSSAFGAVSSRPQLSCHAWKYFSCGCSVFSWKRSTVSRVLKAFTLSLWNWKLPLAYRGLLWESYSFSGLGFSTQFVIYHKMFAISWRFLYPYYFTF